MLPDSNGETLNLMLDPYHAALWCHVFIYWSPMRLSPAEI